MRKFLLAITLALFVPVILSAQPLVTDIQPQGGGITLAVACAGQTIRVVGIGFQSTGMTITVNSGSTISIYNFINSANIEFAIPVSTPLAGLGVVVTNIFPSIPRVLVINPSPTIITAPTQQNVCEGSLFSFSVVTSGGTLAYLWKKNGTATTGILPLYTGIASVADSGDLYSVQITDLLCGTSINSTPVKLIVNTKPTNPPILPDLHNCASGNFTLNAPTPNVGLGSWSCSLNCAGINLSNVTNPNSLVSGVTNAVAPVLQWMVANGACSSTSIVNIVNDAMPTSTATIFGNDTSICITSSPSNLMANSPSGLYTSKAWSLQTPLTGSFSNPSTNYTNFTPTSGAGVYKVNYTIYNGSCSSTSPTKRIIVYDVPTVSAGADKMTCFGNSLNLTGNISNASSFVWGLIGNHGTLTSASSLTTIYGSAGDDSLGVDIALSLTASNDGCGVVSDTAVITIHEKPHAFIPANTNDTVCFGNLTSIPITLSGKSPFTGLGLYNGSTTMNLGTVVGSPFNQSVLPSSTANYNLVVIGNFKDANNCIGAVRGYSAIAVMPVPTATMSVTPSSICSGENAQFTIQPAGGASVWKVYANTGGSNIIKTITGNYSEIINPGFTTTYYIDSIETSTCGKIKLTGINKTVTVKSPPIVAYSSINASKDTLCKGESNSISISFLQSNTIYTIRNLSNQLLDSIVIENTVPSSASVNIPFSKFNPGNIDTLYFKARRDGCSAMVASYTKRPVWVSALQAPIINVYTGTSTCDRKILQTSSLPYVSYQWYEGTNKMIGNLSYKDTIYYSGNYSVKVKDTLSCKLSSNAITVDYSLLTPVVSATAISETKTKLSTTATATNYYWFVQTNNGIKKIQGANLNSLTVYFDGNYYLGTSTNTCFNLSEVHTVSGKKSGSLLRMALVETDSTVELPEPDFNAELRAYPNPVVNSDITVDYWSEDEANTIFTLYNPQGVAVFQKEVTGVGSIQITIPSKGLSAGIYNLVVGGVRRSVVIY